MSTTKSKKIKHLDAGDFADDSMIKAEQGVFQEITPSEIRDTLGVTSAEDYDNGDFIQSDGTNWVGKSVSEIKTLLGLPVSIYVAKIQQSSTNHPHIYEPKVNNFDEDFFTLTEVVPNTIWTASEFIRTDQGTYALNIGSKGGLPTGGAIDIKVTSNDSADGKYLSIDTSGAHLILRQFDKDGVAQDGFTAILTIKKWA